MDRTDNGVLFQVRKSELLAQDGAQMPITIGDNDSSDYVGAMQQVAHKDWI